MHGQTTYYGLGEETCGWWCRQKNKLKRNAGTILTGLLTGGIAGAVSAITVALVFDPGLGAILINGNTYNITDNFEPANEKEKQALEFWHDQLYTPFLLKINDLITGTNAQKNRALILLSIYENVLKEQLIATKEDGKWFYIDNMTYNGLLHRYAYVLSIHNDLRNMLTIKPGQKTKVETNAYLQELKSFFENIAYTEINYTPTKTEVLLLPADTPVVDVDLNNPRIINETEDLTTKVTNPISADGKNIAEVITDVVKTKNTDKVKVDIIGETKTDGTKETITITDREPTKKDNSNLSNTFKQALIFAGVAYGINKIFK